MTARRRWPAVLLIALAGSQFGHLVSYQLRLGPQASAAQSSGRHAYFPAAISLSAALLGAAVITGLLLLGGARLLIGRRCEVRPPERRRPSLAMVALLFALQLAVYMVQETGEALASAATLPSAADLLLWGMVGQLPVAAAAAVALTWLGGRLRGALSELRYLLEQVRQRPSSLPAHVEMPDPGGIRNPLQASAPAVFVKRGPPTDLPSTA